MPLIVLPSYEPSNARSPFFRPAAAALSEGLSTVALSVFPFRTICNMVPVSSLFHKVGSLNATCSGVGEGVNCGVGVDGAGVDCVTTDGCGVGA